MNHRTIRKREQNYKQTHTSAHIFLFFMQVVSLLIRFLCVFSIFYLLPYTERQTTARIHILTHTYTPHNSKNIKTHNFIKFKLCMERSLKPLGMPRIPRKSYQLHFYFTAYVGNDFRYIFIIFIK